MRVLAALAITVAHGIAARFADHLPDPVAAVLAATVYGPLWLASALRLPVFGAADSGGWPGPSLLGWVILALVWLGAWLLVVSLLQRLRARWTRTKELPSRV